MKIRQFESDGIPRPSAKKPPMSLGKMALIAIIIGIVVAWVYFVNWPHP